MLSRGHRAPRSANKFGLNAIAGRIREYVSGARLRHEFDGLTSEEVADVARDVGVGALDLVRFVKAGPHAADQLPKLMHALDFSPSVVDNEGMMRDLKLACIACPRKAQCDHDLALGTATENLLNYCPNARVLMHLRRAN